MAERNCRGLEPNRKTNELTDGYRSGGRGEALLYRPLLSRGLFLVGFASWLVWRVFSTSVLTFPDGSLAHTAIHYGSLAVLLLAAVFGRKKPVHAIVALVLFALGAVVYLRSGDAILVDLAVILYACSLFPLRWVMRIAAIVVALSVAVVVAMSQVGLARDYLWPRGDGTVRHGLGFLYCTYVSHYYLNLVLVYLYLREDKLRWIEYAPIVIINLIIYFLTDSRNSFLLVLLAVVLSIGIRFEPIKRLVRGRAVRSAVCCVFALCAVLSIVATVAYDGNSSAWRNMNSLLSNRLEQTQTSFHRYGISPFGREIAFVGNGITVTEEGIVEDKAAGLSGDQNYVDCSYMNVLIRLGALALLAAIAMLTAGCLQAVAEDCLVLQIGLVVTALHSLVDPQLLELPYDFFLIVCFVALCELIEKRIAQRFERANSCEALVKHVVDAEIDELQEP
ncbi:hypothetical protein [Olsenella sp. An270]|uniref:hypothetical protein n=1 Tax=Olsenella sp. An270 TaxID=1965615 RepID=UPI00117C36EC|nr:hypothetical protein [Olsenella sp. An270]